MPRPRLDAANTRANLDARSPGGPPVRIAVISENRDMLGLLRAVLTRDGRYVVKTEGSLFGGFETVAAGEADVAILDCGFPEDRVFHTLEAIHGTRPACPLIFITSYALPDINMRALRCGARCFLAKPFRREVLLNEVRSVAFPGEEEEASGGVAG